MASGHVNRANRSHEGGAQQAKLPAIPNWRIF